MPKQNKATSHRASLTNNELSKVHDYLSDKPELRAAYINGCVEATEEVNHEVLGYTTNKKYKQKKVNLLNYEYWYDRWHLNLAGAFTREFTPEEFVKVHGLTYHEQEALLKMIEAM